MLVIGSLAIAVAAGGCSAKRFEYNDAAEIPEGPGMFSGEDGAFQVGATAVTDARSASPRSAECGYPDQEKLEAYREFLRWKAEAVGTPEYREFQDWREWRRQQSE